MRGTKVKRLKAGIARPAGTPWKRMFRAPNGAIINDGFQGKLRQVKKMYLRLNSKERSQV